MTSDVRLCPRREAVLKSRNLLRVIADALAEDAADASARAIRSSVERVCVPVVSSDSLALEVTRNELQAERLRLEETWAVNGAMRSAEAKLKSTILDAQDEIRTLRRELIQARTDRSALQRRLALTTEKASDSAEANAILTRQVDRLTRTLTMRRRHAHALANIVLASNRNLPHGIIRSVLQDDNAISDAETRALEQLSRH